MGFQGITIHKSQGLTLEKWLLSLGKRIFLLAYLLWQFLQLNFGRNTDAGGIQIIK